MDIKGWRPAGDGEPEAYVLVVAGEIDTATVATLDHALDVAVTAGARHVLVDLAGVTFLDSSGLRSLIHASRTLEHRAGRLTCTHLSEPVKRVLEISGLLRHLTQRPSNGPR